MRHKPDNKWGLKTIIICMTFVVASICVYGSQLLEGEMKAETASTRFNLYDKVNITSDTYTVIDNSNNQIKLLCDSNWCTTGTTYTYSDTDKYLNGSSTSSYGYYYNSHGYEGRSVLTGKFSIPSTADLQNVTTGDTLDSRIATSSSGFWLSDSGGTNRQKYIDQNNSFLGENTVYDIPSINIVKNEKICTNTTKKESGILPISVENPKSNSKQMITKSTGLKGYSTFVNDNKEWKNVKAYTDRTCGMSGGSESPSAPQNSDNLNKQTVNWTQKIGRAHV